MLPTFDYEVLQITLQDTCLPQSNTRLEYTVTNVVFKLLVRYEILHFDFADQRSGFVNLNVVNKVFVVFSLNMKIREGQQIGFVQAKLP